MNDTLNKIADTIRKYNMINPGDSVVAGVSGGPDSICMLHSLRVLSVTKGSPAEDCRIIAVHVNHNIRGDEADADQDFVVRFCNELGIECVVKSFDVAGESAAAGESMEEAGRRLRYGVFGSVAAENGANLAAVAHNKNDQAETVLMRIMRGTGIRGLSGIEHVREMDVEDVSGRTPGSALKIIRPVLDLKRSEIEEYCAANGLETRTDSTNLKDIYTRNRIRLKLLPYMEEEFNPNVVDALARLASQAKDHKELVRREASRFVDLRWNSSEQYLELCGFDSLNAAVAAGVLTRCLEGVGIRQNVYAHQLDRLMELALSPLEPREADIAENVYARRSYGKLWFAGRGGINNTNNTNKINADKNTKTGKLTDELYIPFPMERLESDDSVQIDTGEGRIIKIRKYKNDNENKYGNENGGGNISVNQVLMDYGRLKAMALEANGAVVLRNRRPGDRIHLKGMKGTKKLQDLFVDRKIPKRERDSMLLIAVGSSIALAGREVCAECRISGDTRWIISVEY